MVRKFGALLLFSLVCIVFLPDPATAQSQINGVVRDESGGVLPGVTVEASSPVLIEKVRSAVTDDQGRFNIIDLRPGVYRITFTLTGFNTVVREGLEVPGGVARADDIDQPAPDRIVRVAQLLDEVVSDLPDRLWLAGQLAQVVAVVDRPAAE